MPFCTQCGHQAKDEDVYCGSCGARQATAGPGPAFGTNPVNNARPASPPVDPLSGLTARYGFHPLLHPTIGWIPAVIVLAARKFRGDHIVRFHAFQASICLRPGWWSAG